MFSAKINNEKIRQGDILLDIPFFDPPGYSSFLSPIDSHVPRTSKINGSAIPPIFAQNAENQNLQLAWEYRSCCVISYCCEISEDNGGKVKTVMVAPLIKLASALKGSKEVESLKGSNDISSASFKGYYKYFYIHNLGGIGECVVDFSMMKTLDATFLNEMKKCKFFEMEQQSRQLLSSKLALYFCRPGQDNN